MMDEANLVSLNTSLLANESGSSGKGFSIISTKIKDLTDKSTFHTLHLEENIKTIAPRVDSSSLQTQELTKL